MVKVKLIAVIGITAASLLILLAGKASAASPPEGWGAATLKVAQEWWGVTNPPLCATEEIEWNVEPPIYTERMGAATYASHPGFECRMWINHIVNVYTMCLVVVHEYGHWLGYGWGTDPESMTYDGDAAGDEWDPHELHKCRALENKYKAPKWRV